MGSETTGAGDVRGPLERWVERAVRRPGRVYRGLLYVAVAFFLVTALFPLYWLVVVAVTPFDRLGSVGLVPPAFDVRALLGVLSVVPVHRYVFNSLVIATLTTAMVLVLASLAGYAFGRLEFPGRRPLFFRAIPDSLEDVARVSGATRLGALVRVVAPLSAPGLATAGVLTFIAVYNEYFFSFLMTDGTVQHWAPLVAGINAGGAANAMAAAAIAGIVPVAVLVFAAQEYIVSGFARGARLR